MLYEHFVDLTLVSCHFDASKVLEDKMVPDQHQMTFCLQEIRRGEKFCMWGGKRKIKVDLKGLKKRQEVGSWDPWFPAQYRSPINVFWKSRLVHCVSTFFEVTFSYSHSAVFMCPSFSHCEILKYSRPLIFGPTESFCYSPTLHGPLPFGHLLGWTSCSPCGCFWVIWLVLVIEL